jgi:hypothetical protein
MGLGLETLVFGVGATWLLALVPAAIITLLKNRISLFFAGLVTLGLTWVIAAVSLAPPDSWWARAFYGEERLARATDPLRHRRSLSTWGLALATAGAVIVALGLAAARPSAILGVDGLTLGHSVGTGDIGITRACRPVDDNAWSCGRYDAERSGNVAYLVRVGDSGCWTGRRTEPAGEESPTRITGCITIVDHILG